MIGIQKSAGKVRKFKEIFELSCLFSQNDFTLKWLPSMFILVKSFYLFTPSKALTRSPGP
jgi:hypothetical protein